MKWTDRGLESPAVTHMFPQNQTLRQGMSTDDLGRDLQEEERTSKAERLSLKAGSHCGQLGLSPTGPFLEPSSQGQGIKHASGLLLWKREAAGALI